MTNVFIDVGSQVSVTIVKNGYLALIQEFPIDDQMLHNLLKKLWGLEIDTLVFIVPGIYRESPLRTAYVPFKVSIEGNEFFCNFDKKDLHYLLQIKNCVKCTKSYFIERTGFMMTMAPKNTISYENYGKYAQFYVTGESLTKFVYTEDFENTLAHLQSKYSNYSVQNASNFYSEKLLVYVKNRNLIKSDYWKDIKGLLSLCLFSISTASKNYVFQYDEEVLAVKPEQQKAPAAHENKQVKISAAINQEKAVMSEKPKKVSVKVSKKSDTALGKRHTVFKERYTKLVFLFTLFINMCLLGVSVFCRRDVIALTKQSSQMLTELDGLNSQTQLMRDANTKKVQSEDLDRINQVLAMKLDFSIGEIKVDWDGGFSILAYVESLDSVSQLESSFSRISTEIETTSEGTILIDNKLWYKIRFTFK